MSDAAPCLSPNLRGAPASPTRAISLAVFANAMGCRRRNRAADDHRTGDRTRRPPSASGGARTWSTDDVVPCERLSYWIGCRL